MEMEGSAGRLPSTQSSSVEQLDVDVALFDVLGCIAEGVLTTDPSYGAKAGTVLRKLLPVGTEVRLQRDERLDNKDRYERLLRYVFRSRKNVNLLLVEKGAASIWYYQGDRGRYADKLLRAAERAKANDRGAWGACEAELTPESAFNTRPKTTEPPPPPPDSCHPSYAGACLDPSSSDYDCAGGEGDGPDYTGAVRVVGPDDYDLDRDGDGFACE